MNKFGLSPLYEDKLEEIRQLIFLSSAIENNFKRVDINYEAEMRQKFISEIINKIKEKIDDMGLNAEG